MRHTLLLLGMINLLVLGSCSDRIVFIIASDPHFTGDSASYAINREMVEDMNTLSGMDCPEGEGTLHPRFVWMLGDMTDGGKQEQWKQYTDVYGLNGENLLKYPLFECFGNHDGNVDGIVREEIRQRNDQRKTNVNTDTLGLHYSWDMKNIHFVNLNLYPANDWDPGCDWCKYFKESFREAERSLDFLAKDLKNRVGDSGRPVVLAFHLGFDDFGKQWWTESDREIFYQVIKDYNVTAIFNGHNHQVGKRTWRGIDVWAAGSPRHDQNTGDYLVVSIDKKGKATVAVRELGKWSVN